jgi:hypothetical protein
MMSPDAHPDLHVLSVLDLVETSSRDLEAELRVLALCAEPVVLSGDSRSASPAGDPRSSIRAAVEDAAQQVADRQRAVCRLLDRMVGDSTAREEAEGGVWEPRWLPPTRPIVRAAPAVPSTTPEASLSPERVSVVLLVLGLLLVATAVLIALL